MRWTSSHAAALILLVSVAGSARADTVLRVDGPDIYVDLGSADGVGPGTSLTVLHVVTVKDPVTGAQLRDRFPVGRLQVRKAGEHLSVASAPPELQQRVVPGDEVAIASGQREFVDPWLAPEHDSTGEYSGTDRPAVDLAEQRAQAQTAARDHIEAAQAARAAWEQTLGQPIATRILVWQEYLRANPGSPYADEVRTEIASLRSQAKALVRAQQAAAAANRPRTAAERDELLARTLLAIDPDALRHGPLAARLPQRVSEGAELELAFAIVSPNEVGSARLYYRNGGQNKYRGLELRADGDRYLRARIPANDVRPPRIEYFVEVDSPEPGPAQQLLGTPAEPATITVDEAIIEPPPDRVDRSSITVSLDYVDFDGGLNRGFDQYYQAELEFTYRFRQPIYAMRIGFGTMNGVGGPKDVIDEDPTGQCRENGGTGDVACQDVSVSYAYTEFEYRFSDVVSAMARPQFGTGNRDPTAAGTGRCQGEQIAGCDFFTSLGFRARIRFGEEQATNLALAVGLTGGVGTMLEAAFRWDVLPQFPVLLSAQVTDLPVRDAFGVRLITDVWWRATDWFYPSVRLAYQARDVDHAGVSGGLALNFDW